MSICCAGIRQLPESADCPPRLVAGIWDLHNALFGTLPVEALKLVDFERKWGKSASPNVAQKLVGQYLLALALYLHSAERLHLISPGHQIMGCLAQDDITCELLG